MCSLIARASVNTMKWSPSSNVTNCALVMRFEAQTEPSYGAFASASPCMSKVVNTNTYNQALIGSGAQVQGGSSVAVDADTDNEIESTALARAGGLVGLGASVATVNDSSVTLAQVQDGASIGSARRVSVDANASSTRHSTAWTSPTTQTWTCASTTAMYWHPTQLIRS
jgi:hypothetical protein